MIQNVQRVSVEVSVGLTRQTLPTRATTLVLVPPLESRVFSRKKK